MAREQLRSLLAVAQESRRLDGTGGAALGPVERQTAGDGLGVCDAFGIAAGLCGRQCASGAEPICEMVSMGADGG